MALQKQITTAEGFTASSAYHKVKVNDFPLKRTMAFEVQVYKDSNKDGKSIENKRYTCAYDLNGSDVYAQAYSYLKSLDEYSDATDI